MIAIHMKHLFPIALSCASLLFACHSSGSASDQGLPDILAPADASSPPDAAPEVLVGAVQYGDGDHAHVEACDDNLCGLLHYVGQAAEAGALVVVTPEYALGQVSTEPCPDVDSDGLAAASPVIRELARAAADRDIHLVVNLLTHDDSGVKHNSQVALGPDGRVLATHHKFNLYGNEDQWLAPGSTVAAFDSPAGATGLLICADIYGKTALIEKLTTSLGARVIAVSLHWMKADPSSAYWLFAKGYGVYLIAANTTSSPGYGGGIYGPDGKPLADATGTMPSVVIAPVPQGSVPQG
jgi:predicted amidohydrolase